MQEAAKMQPLLQIRLNIVALILAMYRANISIEKIVPV